MEPRVDLIVNRIARRLARGRERGRDLGRDRAHDRDGGGTILAALRAEVLASGGAAALHETTSFEELEAVVSLLRARGTSCVLLAGGDGSYLAGTTALVRAFGDALPVIGFAPGGTVSTVARNWGLSGDEATYARRLVRQALDGTARITERPTLRVRDDRGGDRVGFIFGAGLVARFFDAYEEAPPSRRGYAAAALLVAEIFGGTFTGGALAARVLTPSPARLFVDGVRQSPEAWSLIAASVVRDLGLHMHLLYRAAESPQAFHAVASALPPRRLAPQVARVLRGAPLRGEGHVDALMKELRVELGAALGGRPGASTYVLDGDRIRASAVTITAGPVLRHASVR